LSKVEDGLKEVSDLGTAAADIFSLKGRLLSWTTDIIASKNEDNPVSLLANRNH
jgi:hypothetical protein